MHTHACLYVCVCAYVSGLPLPPRRPNSMVDNSFYQFQFVIRTQFLEMFFSLYLTQQTQMKCCYCCFALLASVVGWLIIQLAACWQQFIKFLTSHQHQQQQHHHQLQQWNVQHAHNSNSNNNVAYKITCNCIWFDIEIFGFYLLPHCMPLTYVPLVCVYVSAFYISVCVSPACSSPASCVCLPVALGQHL